MVFELGRNGGIYICGKPSRGVGVKGQMDTWVRRVSIIIIIINWLDWITRWCRESERREERE